MMEEQFSWRVRELVPDALRILDTVDLHSLRRARQRSAATGDPSHTTLLSDDTIRELASIYRSDLSLIISRAEFSLLTEHFGVPRTLLHTTGFLYPAPAPFQPWEDRAHVAFIGNGLHEPNLDAVRLLKHTLWAPIRTALAQRGAPNVELHIYGAYLPQEITQFDNPREGFRIMGKAADVYETLRSYRCNLAPLRFGAGLKGKVSDGWMAGTPCVATPMAAEGMTLAEIFGGIIEEDLNRYPEQVATLYTERQAWNEAQSNGKEVLMTLFSTTSNALTLQDQLIHLIREKHHHRERNIVGALLWYHGLRSTEYFSRWIEAKNRSL
jgi:hypothetical protein